MDLFGLGLSRLVPLLFGASAALLLARFGHDRLLGIGRSAARAFFGGVLVAAAFAALPFVTRSVAVVRASWAFDRMDWRGAADAFARYRALGGSFGQTLGYRFGVSLVNQRRFAEAERALVLGVAAPRGETTVAVQPRIVLALGICRYYLGRFPQAEAALRSVGDPPLRVFRAYFLGRILERRGAEAAARGEYEEAVRRLPLFLPATYQLVRLDLVSGDARHAMQTLEPGLRSGRDPAYRSLAEMAARGETPPPREFFLVLEG